MSKVIDIGKSKTEVQLAHAKRSVIYFVKNYILSCKLLPYQEKFIKSITKTRRTK
jgi:sulfur relay (sulfurtransferase) DsrC/TusE family protein